MIQVIKIVGLFLFLVSCTNLQYKDKTDDTCRANGRTDVFNRNHYPPMTIMDVPWFKLRGPSKDELTAAHEKFLSEVSDQIRVLENEKTRIINICGNLPEYANKGNARINAYNKAIEYEIKAYERAMVVFKIEESRNKFYSDQKLKYNDDRISFEIKNVQLDFITSIGFEIISKSKTKILPAKIAKAVFVSNKMGGTDAVWIVTGVRLFDEYKNSYIVHGNNTYPTQIRPEEITKLSFSTGSLIKAAKFLILKVEAGVFSNSKPISFKIRLFNEEENKIPPLVDYKPYL